MGLCLGFFIGGYCCRKRRTKGREARVLPLATGLRSTVTVPRGKREVGDGVSSFRPIMHMAEVSFGRHALREVRGARCAMCHVRCELGLGSRLEQAKKLTLYCNGVMHNGSG